jgi:hypothetical protein
MTGASVLVLAMRFFASEVCGTARTKDAERFDRVTPKF